MISFRIKITLLEGGGQVTESAASAGRHKTPVHLSSS